MTTRPWRLVCHRCGFKWPINAAANPKCPDCDSREIHIHSFESEVVKRPIHPIRVHRMARLLTQRQLARKARVAVRTVYAVEKGAGCHMRTRRALLRALGIPFERHRDIWPTETPRRSNGGAPL